MSVLDGDDIVYVACAAVRRIMSLSISVGTRFTAYTTSMGCVLLAASDAPRPETLERPTPRSLAMVASLRAELARVRSQGYSLEELTGELLPRSRSAAAQIEAGLR